jgi:hypothetical protein
MPFLALGKTQRRVGRREEAGLNCSTDQKRRFKERKRTACHAAREKFGSSTFEKHARYFERTEGHHHFVEPRVSETEIGVFT